jgi:hypothetical protein
VYKARRRKKEQKKGAEKQRDAELTPNPTSQNGKKHLFG